MNYHSSFSIMGHTLTQDSDWYACLLLVLTITVINAGVLVGLKVKSDKVAWLSYFISATVYFTLAIALGILRIQIT